MSIKAWMSGLCCLTLAIAAAYVMASDASSCTSCTSCGSGCEPQCRASWNEVKAKKPVYSMKCEYACARARDSWHAPEPDCRCNPPCGNIYVKKRFYKVDGKETVERVPKYEVEMVRSEPCECSRCSGGGGWWPLFSLFHGG